MCPPPKGRSPRENGPLAGKDPDTPGGFLVVSVVDERGALS